MAQPRVTCPGCAASFKIRERHRGTEVTCPSCSVGFLVPTEGNVGEALPAAPEGGSGAEEEIQVRCPKCQTAYGVPPSYRGEQAECCKCDAVFRIPQEGDEGELMPAGAAADPDEAGPPAEQATGEEVASGPVASGRVTSSGIQEVDFRPREKGGRTVVLSRSAVLQNTMKPQKLGEQDAAAQRRARLAARRRRRAKTPALETNPDAPFAEAVAEAEAEPSDAARTLPGEVLAAPAVGAEPVASDAAVAPSSRASASVRMPDWVPPLELEPGEDVIDYEESEAATDPLHLVCTLVPVLLIPAAALFAGMATAVASAGAFTVLGGVVWAIYVFKVLPVLNRKILIRTTERAVFVSESEILEVDVVDE